MERPWHDALQAANARKRRIRQVRAELQAGLITLSQALADPGVRGLHVGRVVQWLPRYGPHRTDALLRHVQISPVRRCSELTERQRALIEKAAS